MADPTRGIPVIDVGPLYDGSASGTASVADAIGRACRDRLLYAAGHKVSPELVAGGFAAAQKLFALPAAQKMRVSIKLSPHNRGYVGLLGEALDPSKPRT